MDANGFERLIEQLRSFTPRTQVVLEEVPAPQKLATHAFAFSADVSNGLLGDSEDEIASGRFVLLHEPGGQETWEGEFRCVTFVRADVDTVMQEDPLTRGWLELVLQSLESSGCEIAAPSGTVTRVASASFGKLSPRNDESEIEIRAHGRRSWRSKEIMNHIAGWCTLISEVAGLEAIPQGVSAITTTKRR